MGRGTKKRLKTTILVCPACHCQAIFSKRQVHATIFWTYVYIFLVQRYAPILGRYLYIEFAYFHR